MTTRDAERTTGTPPPLIVCARLSPLRKVLFCSLSAPPMLPLVYYTNSMSLGDKVACNKNPCNKYPTTTGSENCSCLQHS